MLNFETLRQTKYLCYFSLCIKSTDFLLVDFLLSFSGTMIFRVKKNSWWLIHHSFFFFTGTLIYDIKWNSKEKICISFSNFYLVLCCLQYLSEFCVFSLSHTESTENVKTPHLQTPKIAYVTPPDLPSCSPDSPRYTYIPVSHGCPQ